MRTTIELKPEHRAALLALAAQRGLKGFSSVLEEAIQAYIDGEAVRAERRRNLLSLAGSIPADEVTKLRHVTQKLRGFWR